VSDTHERRLWLTIYLACVISAGALVVGLSVHRVVLNEPGRLWFILAALTMVTAFGNFRLPFVPINFSISDMFTMLAALLFGPEAGALLVVLDGLTLSARPANRKFRIDRVLFNATAPALSMWVAAHLFFFVAGVGPLMATPGLIQALVGPLTLFAGVYLLLNSSLVAIAVALESHQSPLLVWRRHSLKLWLTFFGGASIAALTMVMMGSEVADLNLLFLVVPLIAVLYLMFKAVIKNMEDEFEQVKRVNRRYHSLIQGATYGIAQAAIDGRFIAVNPALGSILGYQVSELLERNLWSDVMVDPAHREKILTATQGAAPITGLELPWRRKDGRNAFVRISGRLVQTDAEREPTFEMMIEDVTERRALEEQIRQAQKLDAIGRLASGVAHDFNNLLTVIIGSAELAKEMLGPNQQVDVELHALLRAAGTAAGLTRQLLAFSRQQSWRPVEVDMNGVIQGMSGLLQRLVSNSITIEFELASGLPPVFADRGQLEQVLMNLTINARDAMPDGGQVVIATSVTEPPLDANQPAGVAPTRYVTMRVTDTGFGMSEDVLLHIFEPFFTTKEVGKGSGLGLATVYGIVRKSGGEILVSSRPNYGTTFTIQLPASEAGKVADINSARAVRAGLNASV
jgi:PAS domain S-box-containing protein